jgi:hypothetical protein
VKTIAAVADDLLGTATGMAPDTDAGVAPVPAGRLRRFQDLSVVAAVVATEAGWVAFLAYELWFRLL